MRQQKENVRDIECAGIDFVAKCPLGNVPKLSPVNEIFHKTIMVQVMPVIFDGMGGLNLSNIQVIFDEEGIEKGPYRRWLFNKILVVVAVIKKIKEQEKK